MTVEKKLLAGVVVSLVVFFVTPHITLGNFAQAPVMKKNGAVVGNGTCISGGCRWESWDVDCGGGGTVYGISGPPALMTEAWYAELQGGDLGSTAVRCWCNNTDTTHYDNDYIDPEGYHWTFIRYLTFKGERCTCGFGEMAWVELDPDKCKTGMEHASGFFYRDVVTSGGVGVKPLSLFGSIVAALALL